MRKIFSLYALAMLLMANAAHAQTSLRTQLEKARSDYNAAIKTKDANKLKESLSSYRYSVARNSATQLKVKFPAEFFGSRSEIDNVRSLTYGSTTQRGNTASQMYYHVTKTGPRDNPKNTVFGVIFLIYFVKENNRWKYDYSGQSFLPPNEAQRLLDKKKLSPTFEAKFLPSGKVLPALPEVKVPDFVGDVHVATWGFKISISINDGPKTVMTDEDFSSFLAGLYVGKNTIEYSVESMGKARKYPSETAEIRVDARRSGDQMWNPELGLQVFSFSTKTLVGTTKKEFFVDEKLIPKSGY